MFSKFGNLLVSGIVEDASKVQILLFNTTMSDWVKKVTFLRKMGVGLCGLLQ